MGTATEHTHLVILQMYIGRRHLDGRPIGHVAPLQFSFAQCPLLLRCFYLPALKVPLVLGLQSEHGHRSRSVPTISSTVTGFHLAQEDHPVG
jgi:hypothetical protein